MDGKQQEQVSERLMRLDPGSDEFKRLLLKIAEDSDHPNDVAIAKIFRKEFPPRLVMQAVGGLCTYNYAFFEWKPCHRPAVALIWWDSLGPPLGTQVCNRHLIMAVKAALAMGAVVVGRR